MNRRDIVLKKIGEDRGKSVSGAMRQAGYSPKYARHPEQFLATKKVKKVLKPFLERLEFERDAALQEMLKKRKKARYCDLTHAVDSFSKLGKLEKGEPTEIAEIRDLSQAIQRLSGIGKSGEETPQADDSGGKKG